MPPKKAISVSLWNLTAMAKRSPSSSRAIHCAHDRLVTFCDHTPIMVTKDGLQRRQLYLGFPGVGTMHRLTVVPIANVPGFIESMDR
jgi:hypothetical protein